METKLDVVSDGEELMKYLDDEANSLPDFLFLDLNMPRKNGTECLEEIRGMKD
jgi:DNA-binding response OmpR family regulator